MKNQFQENDKILTELILSKIFNKTPKKYNVYIIFNKFPINHKINLYNQ